VYICEEVEIEDLDYDPVELLYPTHALMEINFESRMELLALHVLPEL